MLSYFEDKIAKTIEEMKDVIFANGFDRITDLEIGPDGYIFCAVLSQRRLQGWKT